MGKNPFISLTKVFFIMLEQSYKKRMNGLIIFYFFHTLKKLGVINAKKIFLQEK